MKRKVVAILLMLVAAFSLFAADRADQFAEVVDRSSNAGNLTLYFVDLDVPEGSKDKSGDCTIIISPDGKVMMVDCGHPDSGKDVRRVMDALGLKRIDIFLNTHPHIDHLGAFPEVADTYEIGTVYRSALAYDTQYTRAFDAAIKTHNLPVQVVAKGDSFMLGDAVKVEMLWPEGEKISYPKGYPMNATQFINDHSIALRLTYGTSTVLLCGDLYRSAEREVLDLYGDALKSVVAKANHHGIDTSNQRKWIKTVHPQVVVAMNDVMGSMDVYRDYVKYGATFYHTLYNGTVRVRLDDKSHVSVLPQRESWVDKGGT